MKIAKSLEESGLLIKGISEKRNKSLLVNLLTGKATIRTGEGTIGVGLGF